MTKRHKYSKEWLQDPSVKYWFETVNSPNTLRNHKKSFPKFLKYVKMTPTQLIEERKKDLQSSDPKQKTRFEHLFIQYYNSMVKSGTQRNTALFYLSTPRSFFASHQYPIMFNRKQRKIIAPDKPKPNAWYPKNEDVRAMYTVANVRERALLLLLYQSGMSEVDVSKLDIENLNLYDKDGKFVDISEHMPFSYYRSKSGILAQTCISNEALHDIKAYLQTRKFPKKEPLFIGSKGERLASRYINEAIKDLAQKSLGQLAQKFKTKMLRVAFNNALEEAGIHRNYSERMMGHDIGVSQHYSRLQVLQTYEKAFSKLSINQYRCEREATKELEKQFEEQQKQLDSVVSLFEKERARRMETEKKMADLEKKRMELEKKMENILLVDTLEKQYRDEVRDWVKTNTGADVKVEDIFYEVILGEKNIVVDIKGYFENGKFRELEAKLVKSKII